MNLKNRIAYLEDKRRARLMRTGAGVGDLTDEELNEAIALECGVPLDEVTDQLLAELVGPVAAREFGLIPASGESA